MWLNLDTDVQYRFEGDISPAPFFQHVSHLLSPTDTLVLGCYDARPDIDSEQPLSFDALAPA